jgi:WRKY transcription factor 22
VLCNCRKNQVKKVVCQVPADGSSSDVWAWRKYGQKPIKGSPYPRSVKITLFELGVREAARRRRSKSISLTVPVLCFLNRGYYRCSSSKGCAARKQVERCRTDPNTFILTYTGEHNHAAPTHRNSLAGTTRYKFPSTESPPPPSVVVGSSESQQQQPSPSAPSTSAGFSPATPLRMPSVEDDDEEEDDLLVEDMEMSGFDELLFLNGDAADSAAPMETLFDVVDEPFLGSLWASTTAGSPAAVAAGAGS